MTSLRSTRVVVALGLTLAALPAACDRAQGATPAGAAPASSSAAQAATTTVSPGTATAVVTAPASASAVLPAAVAPGDTGAASASAVASAAPPDGPCPPEMALIGKSCVDRWEAHLARDEGGTLVDHPHFERLVSGVRYVAKSEAGHYPQGYISRKESDAACKNAGKRLCSMGEWLRACQGKRWSQYPYGPRVQAGKCNSGKVHLLSKMFGSNGQAWKYDENFNSPALNQEPGFLAKAGEYEGCVSDFGVYDLVGNLHEWVSDSVDEEMVTRLENEPVERRRQPWRDGNGVFMGGFFSTTNEHGGGCKFVTIAHEPTYHDYSTGFRCCKSVPGDEKKKRK